MIAHFVSDVHLHPAQAQTASRFLRYLAQEAREADALYILGDLFDAWIGDDDITDPFNTRVCAGLSALTDAGVALRIMPGNRDFLLGPAFAQATGALLLGDEATITVGTRTVLLMHGDTLCTDDADYVAFRKEVRSAAWQTHFLAQPLPWRRSHAEHLRALSIAHTQAKNPMQADVCTREAAQRCSQHHASLLIHGHTHQPAVHHHDGITRYVLTDWDHDRGQALTSDALI
jgi:UDP-2,3-diacylglucosamine hydrolase